MGIMDELNSVDQELQANLSKLENDRFDKAIQALEREREKKEQEKRDRKKLKAENIQEILENSEEGLDEPHMYNIRYAHSGYEYIASYVNPGPIRRAEPGVKDLKVIMTEREKRIMEASVGIEEFVRRQDLKRNNVEIEIKSITESTNLSQEEQMKLDSIKKKISIIKTNEEAEEQCVLNLDDDEFGNIPIHTSLRKALLASVSIKNGKIILQEKDITTEQQNEQPKSEVPDEKGPQISLRTLRVIINKVLGRSNENR